MNIEKQTAVVLKISPFSETSRVVSWMTASAGKISTIIKGSQRSKSAFLGQYDLFYACEILFYRSPRGTLHILKE